MATDVTQLNSIIQSDPEIQRLLHLSPEEGRAMTTGVFDNPDTKIMDRLKQLGVEIPKGYWMSDGEIQKNPNTFLTKALPIMAAVATAGIGLGAMGPGAAFLTGGGGAAAGGAGTAASGAASTAAPALTAGIPSALPIGAAGTTAGTTGALSLADKLVAGAKKAAPILGSMAKSAQDSNANRDSMLPAMANAQLARDKFALDAPSVRMGQTAKAAALGTAAPLVRNWGGPGSGMRPGGSTSTGGAGASIPAVQAASKPLTDDIIHQDLMDQLAHKDSKSPLDQFGKSSIWDKLLGGASIGTNLLDLYGKKKPGVV